MPRQSSHSTSDVVLGGCIVIATFWSVVPMLTALWVDMLVVHLPPHMEWVLVSWLVVPMIVLMSVVVYVLGMERCRPDLFVKGWGTPNLCSVMEGDRAECVQGHGEGRERLGEPV
jgi:hypothetical protein